MSDQFYKNLAPVYHYVFPVEGKDRFLAACFSKGTRLLDVGCSDARVALALSDILEDAEIEAIDLSRDLLEVAQNVIKGKPHIYLREMNMLHVHKNYGNQAFDGIYCIGNTLVHLENEDQIAQCLEGFYQTLKSSGTMVIQILNYDKILDEHIHKLPLIDNEQITFDREYTPKGDHLTFGSTLTIKGDGGRVLKASTLLYPIRKGALVNILNRIGFMDIKTYSSFKFDDDDVQKLPLILIAKKGE